MIFFPFIPNRFYMQITFRNARTFVPTSPVVTPNFLSFTFASQLNFWHKNRINHTLSPLKPSKFYIFVNQYATCVYRWRNCCKINIRNPSKINTNEQLIDTEKRQWICGPFWKELKFSVLCPNSSFHAHLQFCFLSASTHTPLKTTKRNPKEKKEKFFLRSCVW